MLKNFNKSQASGSTLIDSKKKIFKSAPPLSLNLHTMPKTSNHNLKQWLLLSFMIVAVLVVVAYFLF